MQYDQTFYMYNRTSNQFLQDNSIMAACIIRPVEPLRAGFSRNECILISFQKQKSTILESWSMSSSVGLVRKTIGHFQVTLWLCFKTSLRVKWVWFAWKKKTCQQNALNVFCWRVCSFHVFSIFHVNGFTQRCVLTRAKGNSVLPHRRASSVVWWCKLKS